MNGAHDPSARSRDAVAACGLDWAADVAGNRIFRITTDGVIASFSEGITPDSHPEAVSVGPDGKVWFTEFDGSRVARIGTTPTPAAPIVVAPPRSTR